MQKLRRAKSATEIYAKKRDILEFDGDWLAHIGKPEIRGSWFVYGKSGHGKTSYLTQMAKYLTQFGVVWYDGLEEGDSWSFEKAMQRVCLETSGSQFQLIEDYYDDLMYRLSRRNRPQFCFIDSLQVMKMSTKQYHDLLQKNKKVQFIIVGHAKGKMPEGRVGEHIEYISFVKVYVEGFKAFIKSRYGGIEPFVIYPERAAEYWEDIKK